MITQPFDYNPTRTEVKTGPYTVLSGEYAIISAYVRAGGAFTIDGVEALRANGLEFNQFVDLGTTTPTNIFTVPAGFVGVCDLFLKEGSSGSNTIYNVLRGGVGTPEQIGNVAFGDGFVSFPDIVLAGGDVIQVDESHASNDHTVWIVSRIKEALAQQFYCKTGKNLDITGQGSYTAQIFKIAS